MNEPNSEHMNATKSIMRYIKGKSSFRLKYEIGKKQYLIQGYSDSDFARDNDDRKSTTGQIFFFGNFAITWNTVKQNVVALSSCEAEYIAVSTASCQGMWIIRFVEKILKIQVKPFKVYVDDKSAIALSKNPGQHGRSKHIETNSISSKTLLIKGMWTLSM